MFTRGALLYIGQRLVLIVFTAVAVSSIVFLGVHRLPGDALLNERRPDPAAEAALLHTTISIFPCRTSTFDTSPASSTATSASRTSIGACRLRRCCYARLG